MKNRGNLLPLFFCLRRDHFNHLFITVLLTMTRHGRKGNLGIRFWIRGFIDKFFEKAGGNIGE
jgi:hypothetical protein